MERNQNLDRTSKDPERGSLLFRRMERTDTDLEMFRRAFHANGSSRSADLLHWQYFEPPAGCLYVDFAVAQGTESHAAAIYATFPVKMRVGGEVRLGLQSLDTLTDERFRGKGLFVRLANSVYERCASDGVALVYGFPNLNSAHGFFKRLSWQPLNPMPVMVKPLRLGYLASKLTKGRLKLPNWLDFNLASSRKPDVEKGFALREVEEPGEQFGEVWKRFAISVAVGVERDADYLRWRFRRPSTAYKTLGLFRGGEMLGYVTTNIRESGEGRPSGQIMELLYDPAVENAGRMLLSSALQRFEEANCAAVWAWNFEHSPNHQVFRQSGFVRVPQKMIPHGLNVGARPLALPTQAVNDRNAWYVSLLDSDTD